jgi:SPP1 family predicted phage head-tail adaptor
MKIGRLRHRITFLSPSSNRDLYGDNRQIWTPTLTTWGEILQLRGTLLALAQAKATTAVATHSITMRHNPRVTETMRVQYGPTPFTALTSAFFAALISSQFDCLAGVTTPPPLVYTINSILDPDTTASRLTLLVSVVKK